MGDANKYQTPLKLTSTKHNNSQARNYLRLSIIMPTLFWCSC